ERKDAHAGAELEIDQMDRAAGTNEQIECAPRVWNGGKADAPLEIVLGTARIYERLRESTCRSQGIFNVIVCDCVVAERLAGEALDGNMCVLGEKRGYCRVERRAASGVGGDLAQIRRHFLNEANRRRAAQHAPRAAATESRVSRLVPKLDGHSSPPTVSAISTSASRLVA